ncbi:acetyl-CoA carboxylase biotin carboxylase subunit [Corynebacterium provencense]|uniref:acetyl-CoA carboxylase biotin carboxylase subunit n=1 Tax=Corynebacterium provencense TaxID=1737425 RepID=UPI00098ECADC|nr:biotin carboxylase N-terminal domain-containing protein [Corynebacterium provencense]
MFDTVLVANRGEIACRVIRTLRHMGLRSVAVYSDADHDAPHVTLADTAVHLGPAGAAASYLDIDRVISAARASGAGAVHPGYGFLSENADFVRACADAGIVFIGPPATAVETMGDKITARATVEARGVPTVPGISRPGLGDAELIAGVTGTDGGPGVEFPVLIKPSAGGGGKGMHVVEDASDLPEALATARREAASAFGDDTLFIEHYVDTPRHIEVQVLADTHGTVIHLGERECSLQRRHQKVIEEAPSPLLDEATRERIGRAACDAARACGYRGAGTVEFIVPADRPDHFYFMEMNTRLQVEHPVTEMITGTDLVELQIRVARGEPLPLDAEDVRVTGHAVEARIYAEDATTGFLPTGGTVTALRWPTGPGIRVDAGITVGQEIGTDYDPMLAKIIAHGTDRRQALERLDAALAATLLTGPGTGGTGTNINFCRALLADPRVQDGDLDTGLLDRIAAELTGGAGTGGATHAPPVEALTAVALGFRELSADTARASGYNRRLARRCRRCDLPGAPRRARHRSRGRHPDLRPTVGAPVPDPGCPPVHRHRHSRDPAHRPGRPDARTPHLHCPGLPVRRRHGVVTRRIGRPGADSAGTLADQACPRDPRGTRFNGVLPPCPWAGRSRRGGLRSRRDLGGPARGKETGSIRRDAGRRRGHQPDAGNRRLRQGRRRRGGHRRSAARGPGGHEDGALPDRRP